VRAIAVRERSSFVSSKGWGAGFEIAGRYRLVEMLGKGGMGEVWRAQHLTLNAPIAIKLIEPSMASSQAALKRFMREARAAAALQSPHVVHTSDFGVHENVPYIAMELLTGESLSQRLRRVGVLPPAETARVVGHVARGIQKAHDAGIVHRDLKPDNVFIVSDEDEEIVKVLDFGIAKAVGGTFGEEAAATRTGALLGTPYYMSPEQAQGDRQIDHRSDLWSLGVIAFQCLTARLPFESEGLGSLVLKICTGPIPRPSDLAIVPPGFDEWFARALTREPDQRFQSAKEMAAALRTVLTGEEHSAQRNWSAGGKSSPFAAPLPNHPSGANQTGPHVPQTGHPDHTGRYVTPSALTDSNLTTANAAAVGVTLPRPSPSRSWIFVLGGMVALGGLIAVVGGVVFMKSRTPEPIATEEAPPIAASAPIAAPVPDPAPPAPSAQTPVEPPASAAVAPVPKPAQVLKTTAKETEKPAVKPPETTATTQPTAKPTAPATSKGRLGF
jgi:serine/threonine protein kinase